MCIPPSGPQSRGGRLFIGEAPGPTEDGQARKRPPGSPFVGKTGQEVDRHYLPLAGLRRQNETFVNAIACLPDTPGGKLDPNKLGHRELVKVCAQHHLYPLIERMRPSALIPMGNFALRALGLEETLDLHHGIPVNTQWGIPAFPMYHPALGLHQPKDMLYLRTDWLRLKDWLAGRLTLPYDEWENPDYQEVTDAKEFSTLDPEKTLACDTEWSRSRGAYCFTYSGHPGQARLIRAERQDLFEVLNRKLHVHHAPILFHNWLYDWANVEALGLHLPLPRVVDTMVVAYHLGNLPQGMKALAFRECGMRMDGFPDVVSPYSTQEVLTYYRAAYAEEWPKPTPYTVYDSKKKAEVLYKPQGMTTKLKRFFTDYGKNPEKNVFEMWEKNWTDAHTMIEERLGPWPGMDIAHVPFDEMLYYACRDADALGRVWPVLQHMRSRVRKLKQERWRE